VAFAADRSATNCNSLFRPSVQTALLIAAEDQATEVYNYCKKVSAALKEGREPPLLPATFASAKKDVNIAIGSDGPLQLRVGGHKVRILLTFCSLKQLISTQIFMNVLQPKSVLQLQFS
jgi:hypothetical protein